MTVQLLGSNGVTVASTTTGAGGYYSFDGLYPGAYSVQFTAPAGFSFSPQTAAGSTTDNDSNADLSTGKTAVVTLSAGANDATPDAGLYQPALAGRTP